MSAATIGQRFAGWAAAMPDHGFREAITAANWSAVSAIAASVIAVGAWFPVTASRIGLDPWWSIGFYAGAVALDFATLTQLGPRRRDGRVAALMFLQTLVFQLFAVSLVAGSSTTFGALAYAPALPLVAIPHGVMTNASKSRPFVSVATVAATVAGLAMSPSREHSAVLILIGPATAVITAVLADITGTAQRLRREAESLRTSVQAQLLWEESLRADRLEDSLQRMSSWNHDMRNALASAMAQAQCLSEMHPGKAGSAETRETVADIRACLDLLLHGLDEVRTLTKASRLPTQQVEVVDLGSALDALAAPLRKRFPGVRIGFTAPGQPVAAAIAGGTVSLRRVVENLVVNACEGDGRRGANVVTLAVTQDAQTVCLEVRDNGPGFPAALLDRPVTAFASTKASGTGLGLHSVERIVEASRGALHRHNPKEGGGLVRVELPAATPLRSEPATAVPA